LATHAHLRTVVPVDITFGFNVDPRVSSAAELVGLARTAERSGFDLIGIQDHPYQPGFHDTWSLITYLAAMTERIAFTPNVANLGLRPPAMLAKAAASASSLLGGRIQLGVGAGASGGPIPSMGGSDRSGRHMLRYVRESLTVMRQALDGGVVRLDGDEVEVRGYEAGPVPPERIELWLGASGPGMLANVGRFADGWMSPGSSYLQPRMVPAMRSAIDEAAEAAGRDRSEVRRIYNVFGGVGTRTGRGFEGSVEQWVEWLTTWAGDLGFRSFVFWPITGDPVRQAEVFGNEVIPLVRTALADRR
jgi:alkanesulfonate monooxygenase SsuD/methylene tetrahydromethanopterin reductase-like flavin-dependent oxidoreductase (luciferase family)